MKRFFILILLTAAAQVAGAEEPYYQYTPENVYGVAAPPQLSIPSVSAEGLLPPPASGMNAVAGAGNRGGGPVCVLLKNQSVMEGTVTESGESYVISLQGGNITVAKSQVWMLGRDYEELYTFLRQQVHFSDVEGRSELVRWCLKYHLVDQAGEEIAAMEQAMPESTAIPGLKMRLDAAQRMLVSRQVQDSVFSGENTISQPESPEDRGPTSRELGQMAKTLPRDAVTMFSRRIQPILTKNCMNAGCHGPDGNSDFQLLRPSGDAGGTVTLRNMHAALQQINLANPEASPLLRKPVTRHGKDGRVVFMNRDYATYQLLIAWAYLVARNEYVIPRDRMLPTPKPIPVLTSTPGGVQSVTSHQRDTAEHVSEMAGVDQTLYPQNLYPSEYRYLHDTPAPKENPATRYQRQKHDAEIDSRVIPAGAKMPAVKDAGGRNAYDAYYDPNVTPTAHTAAPEWLEQNAEPETDAETPADGAEPEFGIRVFEVIRGGKSEFVAPKKTYAPGESSENLRHGEMQKAVLPTYQPNTRPLSPIELLLNAQEGVSNYSENDFQYTEEYGKELRDYQADEQKAAREKRAATPRNENRQNGFHPWKDGLEMQRVMGNSQKKD